MTPAITPARSAWSLRVPIAAAMSGRAARARRARRPSGIPTTTMPPFAVLTLAAVPPRRRSATRPPPRMRERGRAGSLRDQAAVAPVHVEVEVEVLRDRRERAARRRPPPASREDGAAGGELLGMARNSFSERDENCETTIAVEMAATTRERGSEPPADADKAPAHS